MLKVSTETKAENVLYMQYMEKQQERHKKKKTNEAYKNISPFNKNQK